MEIITQAQHIAEMTHADQKDLAEAPYIHHVQTVVALTKQLTADEQTIAVAWLHDVVEDSAISTEYLGKQGFPETILEPLRQISRPKHYPYKQYIAEITDSRAQLVKIADLLHNQDDQRLPKSKQNTKRQKKYVAALHTLVTQQNLSPDTLLTLYKDYSQKKREQRIKKGE